MTQALQDLGDYISAALSQDVLSAKLPRGELVITVRAQAIGKVLTFLRDDSNCLFKQAMDITAVDYRNVNSVRSGLQLVVAEA